MYNDNNDNNVDVHITATGSHEKDVPGMTQN